MRIVCAPASDLPRAGSRDLEIVLYGSPSEPAQASVGAAIPRTIRRQKLQPGARAWDLLSIALAVVAADVSILRSESPDGWTRNIDLRVAVNEPDFWASQSVLLARQLRFLTTDIWNLTFFESGARSAPDTQLAYHEQDSVVLLSGGLDSLIGTIDVVSSLGKTPYAVSQTAHGESRIQQMFASAIGGGLSHLQINHNANSPEKNERSQRSRSIVFLAYGVLVATALARYRDGDEITLYVCENGFISMNPPLTHSRLGSLSTRTTHPVFLGLLQQLLTAAGLRVRLENPYQFLTKGEMLRGCIDQVLLHNTAARSTSCGRYRRYGYKHCGRCLPCLIRRAAFYASGIPDGTEYVYTDLTHEDASRHDDVRSAAMAVAAAEDAGLSVWARPALSTALLGDVAPYVDMVGRGIQELGAFLESARVT